MPDEVFGCPVCKKLKPPRMREIRSTQGSASSGVYCRSCDSLLISVRPWDVKHVGWTWADRTRTNYTRYCGNLREVFQVCLEAARSPKGIFYGHRGYYVDLGPRQAAQVTSDTAHKALQRAQEEDERLREPQWTAPSQPLIAQHAYTGNFQEVLDRLNAGGRRAGPLGPGLTNPKAAVQPALAGQTAAQKSAFYQKLVRTLVASGFRFSRNDLIGDAWASDKAAFGLFDAGMNLAGLVGSVVGLNLPDLLLDSHYDSDGVYRELEQSRADATMIALRYLAAAPLVVSVVEADQRTDVELVAVARRFHEGVKRMKKFTYSMGFTKGPSYGVILFVFFDRTHLQRLNESTMSRCRHWAYFGKTCVAPMVIDVSSRRVESHAGVFVVAAWGFPTGQTFQAKLFGRVKAI
jgi:hypothetical protein